MTTTEAAPRRPKRTAIELVAKLDADRADHLLNIRRLERERDDLLLDTLEGDPDAEARTEAIRLDLEARARKLAEITRLQDRFAGRAELERREAAVAQKKAGVVRLLRSTQQAVTMVQAVDDAVHALVAVFHKAREFVDTERRACIPLSVSAGLSPEHSAIQGMIYSVGLQSLEDHVEVRLRALEVLGSPLGAKPRVGPIAPQVSTSFRDMYGRIQDRLREDDAALARLRLEVLGEPEAPAEQPVPAEPVAA